MKNLNDKHRAGDILALQMNKPRKGAFPIAFTKEGAVCKIQPGLKGFFEYGSTWECEVLEVHETKLIVKPLECLVSAAYERTIMEDKAKKLATNREKHQRKRIVKSYPYKRSDEQTND